MPPPPSVAASLVTAIITTSPTPSAPSTELLASVIASFRKHCPELVCCRVVVVFDTYDRITTKPRLKKGCLTAAAAKGYEIYKENTTNLFLSEYAVHGDDEGQDPQFDVCLSEAEYGSGGQDNNSVPYRITQTKDRRVSFVEPSARLGFGLAVRSALRLVETPYVWIHQHDWVLVSDIPLAALLSVMSASSADVPVKYICFPAVRMLTYATSAHVTKHRALAALTTSLPRDFAVPGDAETKIPLTPLFFWHDKPHLVATAHYLERVFPTRLAMLRGAFIEDTIGQRARSQMKEGMWSKWACWLYYPEEGNRICVRHLHGRVWKGAEEEMERIQRLKREGRPGEIKDLEVSRETSSAESI